jgi:[ribosomal protein S18]-alanine N-acetyltransferase
MEERDLSSVLAIEKRSFPNPWHESTFRGEIQHLPISFPLVIVHATLDKVIGYIVFWLIGEEVQINNVAVHPDFRRLGIAEQVLRQVIEQARWKGVNFIALEVRPSNRGALGLYKKIGFRMLGVRKKYYTNPAEDAFVLGLHIRPEPDN